MGAIFYLSGRFMQPVQIEYRFELPGQVATCFRLDFDRETMAPLTPFHQPVPFWAKLDFHRCPHCPLPSEPAADCPAAARLADLLAWCAALVSHESLRLTVVTPERTTIAETTAQRAVSSLMGLIMATSGCPHSEFLRPMARFHLPLASESETIYRAASMYLLAQYFVEREGRPADLELQGLQRHYEDLHRVNLALCDRMRAAVTEDSSVNAVIVLDCFAKALPATIEDALSELEPLFRRYLDAS
jgi:hypothetical protein